MTTSTQNLKSSFRAVFPEYANLLDKAKSQSEVQKLQIQFLAEARTNLAKQLNKPIEELADTDPTASIALTHEQYQNLLKATGDVILQQLQVILDGCAQLKSMEHDDPAAVTAKMISGGVLAIGSIAWKAVSSKLIAGYVEEAAAYAGVEAATVGVVCGIAAVVIVAILIPIIYYIEKPATCIVLLINELDDEIAFKDDHNVHGKPLLRTSPIPQAIVTQSTGTVATAGFIASVKDDNALVGTQYGFTFTYKGIDLSFGVESPLTGIYGANNCYCGIGISAENAANETDSKNVQSYKDSKNEITISIKCNSGSGSIAYYIARAYKTPNN